MIMRTDLGRLVRKSAEITEHVDNGGAPMSNEIQVATCTDGLKVVRESRFRGRLGMCSFTLLKARLSVLIRRITLQIALDEC